MKTMYKFILVLLVGMCSSANSQQTDNWMWLNPKPQGNTLNAVDFINDNTGYAAGFYGTILKTTDNGNTWVKQITGTSSEFKSIDIIDANTGYAGGENQLMKKTIDGGETWTDVVLPSAPNYSVYDIDFINASSGYALGFFLMESRIWKTTDGGQSWSTQTTDGANYINNLYFIDANTGFGSGGSLGGEIIKTINGGVTWDFIYQDSYKKQSMIFINSLTGFAGSEEGRIYKTTDAGNSWNFAISDGGIDVTSLNFINANTGFGFGSGSVFIKTTDGGNNWIESQPVGSSNTSQYLDADITPNGTIHAAGTYGAMVRSTNAGMNFTFESSVTDGYISNIKFVNTTTGYAVTGFNHGDILKTTDAGNTWVSQISNYITSIYGISFTNTETGYLAGSLAIYKTVNGGTNWQSIYNSTTNEIFTDVFFTNANTGYVVGSYGRQLKTTDAGASWNPTTISSSGTILSSLFFTNENTGYAVGDNNAAVKTTNAGLTWNPMSVASPFINLGNVFFTDDNTGYITSGVGIYKTTNAGGSWFSLPTPTGGYNSVQFRGDIGYAVGGGEKIIKSTDAGASWIVHPTVTDNGLSALYFNSDNYIYSGGILGTIIKTIPTELIVVTSFTLNLKALIQGFYNPASDKMVKDTVKVFLRNISSPYSVIDSSRAILDSNGIGNFTFANALNSVAYYVVIRHRNGLETWSATGSSFTSGNLSYDFTTSSSKAYGNNQILTGAKYSIYNGDVNQDGAIDLSDLGLIDNGVYNFNSGYVAADVNGDGFVDISDLEIADNNAINFIGLQRP
ncbi:MAG: YCF48-related protein [Bacteroidota bacterium]|nr:YCF48-related protein [Bacteroidota bacterium]